MGQERERKRDRRSGGEQGERKRDRGRGEVEESKKSKVNVH